MNALPRCPFSFGNTYLSVLISNTRGSRKPRWPRQKLVLFSWTPRACGSHSMTALLIMSCNYLIISHLQGVKPSLQAKTMPCWSLQTGLEWRIQFIYAKRKKKSFMLHGDELVNKLQIPDCKKLTYDLLHYASVIFGFLGLHTRSDPHKGLNIWKTTETQRRQHKAYSPPCSGPITTPGTLPYTGGKKGTRDFLVNWLLPKRTLFHQVFIFIIIQKNDCFMRKSSYV